MNSTNQKVSRKRRISPSEILFKVIMYGILVAIAVCFLIPFMFLFLGSFKGESELFRVPFKWLPDRFSFDNYVKMFQTIPFFTYLRNTLIIVGFNIAGSLISCSLAAYGFARLHWTGRDKVFMIVIVTMILPYQVTLVPLFLLFNKLGWIGTFLPLIVPCFFGNPFFIFLLRQFFVGVPDEITYAARVDGASEFRIYLSILMPMAKPALATVAIFAFIRSWNDFIGPLVFLSGDELYTLSLAASMLKSPLNPNWALLLTLGSLMVLPVLILFFILQKYFIQGIAMSGVKG
ncbi:MAG: carbohydrate ABC transporter permease [Lachnospiraceae bacterium]|nr:carbohydrate ABC transporter permease [Lachnospiraceae bacterium]